MPDPPPITSPFNDLFARDDLGLNYYATAPSAYRLVDGTLAAQGAHNQPLWLRKRLPRDVRIQFVAWSNSPAGDIKVEVMGDGRSRDEDGGAYVSTGYVLIMGGWGNSKSMIARQNEHGDKLITRTGPPVQLGRRYTWRIERLGNRLTWFIDDMTTPFLTYDDDAPLEGDGHAYFAFNNWESSVGFDDLAITPL